MVPYDCEDICNSQGTDIEIDIRLIHVGLKCFFFVVCLFTPPSVLQNLLLNIGKKKKVCM